MARHHGARAAAAALALLCLTGCATDRLQFRNDHRLSFSSPKERDKVTAPLTIEWSMRDFDATGLDGSTDEDRGVFAVFVDRAPMPAGEDLKWLFRNDSGCEHDARCPSLQQLSDRGVLITADTKVTLAVLPQAGKGVGDEQHYVNVVLLDGRGRRHGESAWYLPFRSERRSG